MDRSQALSALTALGHDTRLDTFRLLVQAGDDGMIAGEIGRRLDVRQNTLSANLGILTRAGLIDKRREGRAIRYFARMEGMRGLLAFLMHDCCGGRPDLCQPVLDTLDTC